MDNIAERYFFLNTPDITELVSLTFEIDVSGIGEDDIYNKRIQRCRQIIFAEKDIMATPLLESNAMMLVTMKRIRWSDETTRARFMKTGLHLIQMEATTAFLLKQCLHYTIIAKLAPKWNKVESLLVKGRDFLTSDLPLCAVATDLIVNETQSHLVMKARRIRLPRMTPNNESSRCLAGEECFVLPSMKKGSITSITKFIPEYSSITSYKAMKRYWKNTYGYRLPEDSKNVVYYNVKFWSLSNKLYTYPDVCVRPYKLIVLPRDDSLPIISNFIADFQHQVREINLVSTQPVFPSIQFNLANKFLQSSPTHSGVTNRMPLFQQQCYTNLYTEKDSRLIITNSTSNNQSESETSKFSPYFKCYEEITENCLSEDNKTRKPVFHSKIHKEQRFNEMSKITEMITSANNKVKKGTILDSFFPIKKSSWATKSYGKMSSSNQGLTSVIKNDRKENLLKCLNKFAFKENTSGNAKNLQLCRVNKNDLVKCIKAKGIDTGGRGKKSVITEKAPRSLFPKAEE